MADGKRRVAPARGSTAKGPSKHLWPGSVVALLLLSAVALIAAVAHWPVLSAQADCFDDFQYIDENPLVMNPSWGSAERFLREVSKPSTVTGYYQPLTMISLMLDVSAGASPTNKRPFHRTSLALHLVNTLMVGTLLYLLLGNPWAAAGAALLFSLHPMTVEPIAWSSERKTLLSSFFSLASLLAYVDFTRRGRWPAYLAALLAYLLALLAKPTATPLPAAMLLLSLWPLGRLLASPASATAKAAFRSGPRLFRLTRWNRRPVLELVPFLAVGAVSAIVTFISQRDAGGVSTPGTGYPAWRIPLVIAYDLYLYGRNLLWPTQLSPHNPFPEPLSLGNPGIALGLLVSIGLVVLVLWSLRRTPALFVGAAMFFVLILPALQLVQFSYSVVSDKYAYLPALGLLLVVAWGLERAWHWLGTRRLGPTGAGLAVALVVTGVAAAEVGQTRHQLGYWRTTEALDRHLIAMTPGVSEFHFELGNALWDQGRDEEAHLELERAVELDPQNVRALNNLATSAALRGEGERAIALWRETLTYHPENYVARCNLAYYEMERRDRLADALAQYRLALDHYLSEHQRGKRARALGRADAGAPSQVYAMLGHAHLLVGDASAALEYLRQSIALPEPFPLAFGWLAESLVTHAHLDADVLKEFYQAADELGTAAAFARLGETLRARGQDEEAHIAAEIARALGS